MTTVPIGDVDDFPADRGTHVTVDGLSIAVFNLDGDLYAIQNTCPHKRLPLHLVGHDRYFSDTLVEEGLYDIPDEEKREDQDIRGGIDRDEPSINCPWHYLEWNLADGSNDVTGASIATYDVTVTDDGDVFLTY